MNYQEAKAKWDEARAKLAQAEKEAEKEAAALHEIYQRPNWRELIQEITDAKQGKKDAAEKLPALQLAAAIWRDNTRRALLEELKPAAASILAKYNGKPYGEKTRAKIAEEMKAATGYRVYISDNGSRAEMGFYQSTGYTWKAEELELSYYHGTGEKPALLENNRINAAAADELRAYNLREYIEDPAAHVEKIMEAYREADAAAKAYTDAANKYNALIPTTTAKEIERVHLAGPWRLID